MDYVGEGKDLAISQVTSVHNIKIIWDDQLPNPSTKHVV
jgi:hypothetical protein